MLLPMLAFLSADLSGNYHLTNFREAGAELRLNPNGTFEYEFPYGAADYWAKGTWRVEGEAIVFTSNPDKGTKPFQLIRSSSTTKAPVARVRMVGPPPQSRPVPNIDVVLVKPGGREEARTDSDGVATFEKRGEITSRLCRARLLL